MDNEKGHNRPGHDGLFKLFLREPDTARDFLAVHLPADIRSQVRLDTLKLEPGSFVDQKLRELHSMSCIRWRPQKVMPGTYTVLWNTSRPQTA